MADGAQSCYLSSYEADVTRRALFFFRPAERGMRGGRSRDFGVGTLNFFLGVVLGRFRLL